jgi:ribosome maturation factor RimP
VKLDFLGGPMARLFIFYARAIIGVCMNLSERIHNLIKGSIEELGYNIVRVQIMGKEQMVIQVMAEPKDGQGMSVENCSTISRAISTLLEVDDPINGTYTLEVSSPGLDRPLTQLEDFERFQGFEAKIEINQTLDSRHRFKGYLLGIEGSTVKIFVDGAEMKIPYSDIYKAKLLMTDELIAAAEDN